MNPKHFWGKDMSEALRFVRGALGPDALILETKGVEQEHGGGIEIAALAEGTSAEQPVRDHRRTVTYASASPIDEVRQELAALKSMLCWLAPGLDHKDKIIKALVAQDLAPETISRLSDAMKEFENAEDREKLYRGLGRLISSGGQIREQGDRLALVGPTGVGKTTSLIKLTIFETQRRNRQVGWINTDQHRLTGGDPLAIYAAVLGVEYKTASNRTELRQALNLLSNCDLVLVDSPGVNPRNDNDVKELARLYHGIANLRRTLLISAATNGRDMADWVENFRILGVDSLFFTKLDECRSVGPLINAALNSRSQLSYITLGQNFSGDLAIAQSEVFASLLLTGVESHD